MLRVYAGRAINLKTIVWNAEELSQPIYYKERVMQVKIIAVGDSSFHSAKYNYFGKGQIFWHITSTIISSHYRSAHIRIPVIILFVGLELFFRI